MNNKFISNSCGIYVHFCFRLRIKLLFLLFFPCFGLNYAIPYSAYNFSIIDDRHGLSQNHVKTIIQDKWGFIWFGTQNGLNRYDGENIKRFDCYDEEAEIGNNNISTLYEDVYGNMWVGTDRGVYIFNPIKEKFSIFQKKTDQGVAIYDWVSEIKSDFQNNIWIVIPNQGLFKYNLSKKKLLFYDIGMEHFPDHGNPQCLSVDKNGRVWIGSNGEGIYLYNESEDSFNKFLGNSSEGNLKGKNIYSICDYGDELIIGIHEGKLKKFNKSTKSVRDIEAKNVHYKIIRDIENFDGELWVGTQAGIYIINEFNNKEIILKEDLNNEFSLSDNIVEKIYKDRENGIWIGTKFGGVSYLPNRGIEFNIHLPIINENSLIGRRVREMVEDSIGNIWIATEDAGLVVYNPSTKKFSSVGRRFDGPQFSKTVLGLYYDKESNCIWAGYFKGGLDIIDASQKKRIAYYTKENLGFNEGSIYAICKDNKGNMWIGNGWNVYVGEKETMKFQRVDDFGFNFVYDIQVDLEGNIWVATMGNGVFKYNPETRKTEHFQYNHEDKNSLSSNSVSSITITTDGELWFSTDRGGICKYRKQFNDFLSYSVEDGLPDDVAYKILEDSNKLLWFGTNKGLVKFNPETEKVEEFSREDGLPFNQFNYKSGIVSKSGILYLGGLNGFISFDPNIAFKNTYVPPVYITNILVSNERIKQESTIKKSIIHLDKIELPYYMSNLTIEYASLSYISPFKNRYSYILEGLDRYWKYTNRNSVSYSKLPPGEYVFRVKGSNNDGLWNNSGDSIIIKIFPPWWKTDIALVMYFLIMLVGFYFVIHVFKKKQKIKNLLKQKDLEIKKEKELFHAKIDFFTNIAHEIRTPLTLINGPIESILERGISDPFVKNDLNLIAQNAQHLMNLVCQLLDFRKVESDAFQACFKQVDVTDLLFRTLEPFKLIAERENKKLELKAPEAPLEIHADREWLVKIFNNLFSNAVKFSDSYISIELCNNEDFVIIKVVNDGEKVANDFREKIFSPFFQFKSNSGNNGTGIGLTLVKSLVELLGGHVFYETEASLNVFKVELPLFNKKAEKVISDIGEDANIKGSTIGNSQNSIRNKIKSAKLLIVDDNLEMLNFIAGRLNEVYFVVEANNGKDALQILERETIDLIITDLMMPVMDGLEFCEKVKSNIDFSHIPIIILTVKNDLKSRIEGLEKGAEAYIEKPFSIKYLFAQISNLLNNRERIREVFLKKPFLPIQQMGLAKSDEEFLCKISSLIKENLTDPNFSVERLADLVFMSRSSLHRKIKGLMGISPNEFINLVRLKIAAELICKRKYQISEICYLVGINSPSYFAKLFSKQYGITPKKFQKLFSFQNMDNVNTF